MHILKLAKILGGFYQGKPSSPDTVKKTVNFQGLEIKVDRPRGFIMFGVDSKGKEWKRKYQVDYGFIPKTLGGDGDGLDVFIGPDKKEKKTFWAVQRKEDGSFDEYKVFVGFNAREDAIKCYAAHIPKKYFGRLMTLSVDMMTAMLGEHPKEVLGVTKTAQWNAFFDELSKLAASTRFAEEAEEVGVPAATYGMHPDVQRIVAGKVSLPPVSSLAHPGHLPLKLKLVEAVLQGTAGVGNP
jgi:hypothetical protein